MSSKVLRAHTTPPPDTIREDVVAMLLMATGADEPGLRNVVLEYARGLGGLSADPLEGEEAESPDGEPSEEAVSISVP